MTDRPQHEPGGAAASVGTGRRLAGVARVVWRESFTDRTLMVAAGLSFFALFALLPALAAVAAVFGYFVDRGAMQAQLADLGDVLPEGVPELLGEFLTAVPEGLGLGLTLAGNLVVVLWTVQRSASGIITALNVVYDEEERRSRVRREVVALGIAVGGLVFLCASLFLVAVLPLSAVALLGQPLAGVARLARWPLVALMFMLALGLLYSFAPSRDRARAHHWRWISWGALAATAIWLAASVLFSLYLTYAGEFDRFYGSVTAFVVLLTWLFIGAFVIMVGAEINAQLEARMTGRPGAGLKEELDRRERAGG